jgi:tight adherence protein C
MAFWGGVAGPGVATGVLLVVSVARALRGPGLAARVDPYLGVGSTEAGRRTGSGWATSGGDGDDLLGRWARGALARAASRLDRLLGGTPSVRRRLAFTGDGSTVEQFRLEQVTWGGVGFASTFALLLVLAAGGSAMDPLPGLVLCLSAALAGVLARDHALSSAVRRRTERIDAEFPTVAELLALAVAAGEGAQSATVRVTRVCSGALADELAVVVADARAGAPFAEALQAMASRVGGVAVPRFVDAVVVAMERGTPLAEVLRAQAGDAREVRRRALMDSAGRREIAMLVPVVFLILPLTVLFALFPGFYGLNLSVS